MLEGLMMHDTPLTLQGVLRRMRTVNGTGKVVTLRGPDGSTSEVSYAEIGDRVDRLAAGLHALDIWPGDRVATFMWNNQEHLELYYAIPAMGAVLHTLNLRLFPDQLTYIVDHAEDEIVVVDGSLIPLIAPHAEKMTRVRHWIVTGDGPLDQLPGDVLRYEDVLASAPADYAYPRIDDRSAAGLCYTSGTTGNPKGVLYSHYSSVLHAMAVCLADAVGLSQRDRTLPVVPMFHAMAWGTPYAAGFAGADLILPGPFLQAEPLAKLIESERVSIAAAVPTIWMDLLKYADTHEDCDLSTLRQVLCGGAAVPKALIQGFQERHGVTIVQGWGMTETSPLAAVAQPPAWMEGEEELSYRARAGRIQPLVDVRIMDDDGGEQPWDDEATGEVQVRGPWIASEYYRADPGDVRFTDDGWLRTGDIAAIDETGCIRITDRSKDIIKSGGEWISSVELENELMAHPAVAEAAVIAKPDEKWTERPLACIVRKEGAEVSGEELARHLVGHVAKWWVPDEYAFIDEVPKTSVGKFDKKVLRSQLADGELPEREAVDVHAMA